MKHYVTIDKRSKKAQKEFYENYRLKRMAEFTFSFYEKSPNHNILYPKSEKCAIL